MTRFLAAFAVIVALATFALADTIIPGGNLTTQTWTPAGNPYFIQGDITIPAGASLTIQPGVLIDFSGTDSMAAGLDPTLVEVTVQGTLSANGTTAQPINFRGSNSSSLAWYGIVVDTGATSCVVSNAQLHFPIRGFYNRALGSALQATAVTIDRCQQGVYIDAGAPILSRLTIHDFSSQGVWVNLTGALNLTDSFIYQTNPGGGCLNVTTSSPSVVTHCTFSGSGTGVNHYGTGTLALYNCICQNAAFRGVSHNTSGIFAGAITIDHCDVWNNATNYFGCSAGPGCISANPLLTSPTNARLLAGSPCIDIANNARTTSPDLYGTTRPQDGDGIGGAAPDIGAAEYSCTAPSISAHPAPETTTVGQPASFHVTATGTSLTYQWRKGGVNLVNQGAISGVTTPTLSISVCSAADAGSYDVLVSGCFTQTPSNPATLTVNPAPTCGSADFNGDGDLGTDADIEAFFRVLAGGNC